MISIFGKIKAALTNTTSKISNGIDQIFFKKKLDQVALEELEELLISNDISTSAAENIIQVLKQSKFEKEVSAEIVKQALRDIIVDYMTLPQDELFIKDDKLNVVLISGVNGNGKTTSIGKLAKYYQDLHKKVYIAACDTFRAAAVEQLNTWAKRAEVEIIMGEKQAEAASVAYKAISTAIEHKADIIFIDTAGRLHNHKNLMAELSKIVKVISKFETQVSLQSLLVIDATIGQNAQSQVEEFKEVAGLTGLILTKLDGTAKGGAVVNVPRNFGLPILFIGMGEGADDLKKFDVQDFASALVGL